MLAAKVRSGKAKAPPQKVTEHQTRLDTRLNPTSVDVQLDRGFRHAGTFSTAELADCSARSRRTASKARRYAPGAWMSSRAVTAFCRASAVLAITVGEMTRPSS